MHQAPGGIPAADQHRHGHVRAPTFGGQQAGHRIVIEGFTAQPVEGVGGEYHETARFHGANGGLNA